MVHRQWRRFLPRAKPLRGPVDLIAEVRKNLDDVLHRTYGRSSQHIRVEQLDQAIDEQRQRVLSDPTVVSWFTLLLLQGPRAARAQVQMDTHPHGYKNKQARLYELIDFNDAFVSTVLALPETELAGVVERSRDELARFCAQVHAPMFSEEQYEAITRGLSREVAVYRGAIHGGFKAAMTTRTQDAMGVDMVVTDPVSGLSINVDCKTPSAYRYRIQDLMHEERLSESEGVLADQLGYAREVNGNGGDRVKVVLMRIDPNELGDVVDFSFVEPERLAQRLRTIFDGLIHST